MTNQEIYHDFLSKYDVNTSDYRPLSKIYVGDSPGITIWTDKGDIILYFPEQAVRRSLMADAKQCDICGRLYQQISKTGLHSICFENDYYNPPLTELPNKGRTIDVCPACGAAFVNLYNVRKGLANEKEIRT